MWCKPGQYLDHQNCVCENKLVNRLISECTSIINETMMNNNDNNNDNNFYRIMAYVFIGLFLLAIICFCVFAYFKWSKDKKLFKNKYADYSNVQYIIMLVKSLKIKNESMFYPNDIIQLNNFDGQLLKINKRENRENNNIYYISYKINNLYFIVDYLYGTTEKSNGSKDRYLVINKDNLMNEKNINFFYYLWNTIINKIKYSRGDDIMFDNNEVIIKDWNKIRFSSDIFIPNDNFY